MPKISLVDHKNREQGWAQRHTLCYHPQMKIEVFLCNSEMSKLTRLEATSRVFASIFNTIQDCRRQFFSLLDSRSNFVQHHDSFNIIQRGIQTRLINDVERCLHRLAGF